MKLVNKVIVIYDRVIDFLASVAGAILVFITLSITADVMHRKFAGGSITGVFEISEYSLLFIPLLGAAWVLRREGHVKVGLILDRLPQRRQAFINLITSILSAISLLLIVWYSAEATLSYLQMKYFTPTTLKTPQWIIMSIIPISLSIVLIQFIRRIYSFLAEWKDGSRQKQSCEEKKEDPH
jgi:TRAP-type C4-dicarboxylate transport system permease small subunit